MDVVRPVGIEAALEARAARPDAVALSGGTDVMVDLNLDRLRPPALLDLSRVPELGGWETGDGSVRLGARLTHAEVVAELSDLLPAPRRGVAGDGLGADPQPRHARAATSARRRRAATRCARSWPPAPRSSWRRCAVRGGSRWPTSSAARRRPPRDPDELICALHVPAAAGPQRYAKVAARNAMVMGTCSLAVGLDPGRCGVSVAAGGAGPTPVRAPAAESFAAAALDWDGLGALDDATARRFGELVVAAADPQDDVRGTAAYRRHALAVIARRCLDWCWEEHRCA